MILWMDEFLYHFETMVDTIICWHVQGNHVRVSERWCEMDFVHSRYLRPQGLI